MIDAIEVSAGKRRYYIYVGWGSLAELGEEVAGISSKAAVITDDHVWGMHGEALEKALSGSEVEFTTIKVPQGEDHKSLDEASAAYDKLVEAKIGRYDTVLAFGGGVIGDLAGFVASTYMRGVPFVQVPTTLLAQVDSSVGGKVAVNRPKYKNLVGSFYQPWFVVADVAMLQTLDNRQLVAGLGEVIKCGLLSGEDFLEYLEANIGKILDLDERVSTRTISVCVRFKARVVEEDEFDRGRRHILNYGHTVGHAVEALAGYGKILHGEAISVGMMAAALISHRMGYLDEEEVNLHRSLLSAAGLPTALPEGLDSSRILDVVARDKKRREGEALMVLLEGVGEPRVHAVPVEAIEEVLKEMSGAKGSVSA